MSVAFDLDLDLDLLVGEMPAPPCESPHHDEGLEHSGDGAFYARTNHTCYGPVGILFTICEPYALYWTSQDGISFCYWCKGKLDETDHVEIIGPVNA